MTVSSDPSEQVLVRKLCQTLARGGVEALPVFPVDQAKISRVRERVNIARKLDKLLLDNRYSRDLSLTTLFRNISSEIRLNCAHC